MRATTEQADARQAQPILLYNDECAVCRRIARWVQKSAQGQSGKASILERPIGDDPEALRSLNPALDIWDAYATIHLLMPDGSMRVGGEAVAEVLRHLTNTQWFARCFAINVFGVRPFQMLLNLSYLILADVRPLFGCESCGTPSVWVRPFAWLIKRMGALFSGSAHLSATPHFTSRAVPGPRAAPTSASPPPP